MKKEYYYNAKQKVNLSEKICLLRVSVRVQPEKQNQWVGWVGRLTDRWTDRWTGRQADRQKEGGREGGKERRRKEGKDIYYKESPYSTVGLGEQV